MTARTYATPLQFKQALEGRLRNQSATGADLARRRQLLIFDRFLGAASTDAWGRAHLERRARSRAPSRASPHHQRHRRAADRTHGPDPRETPRGGATRLGRLPHVRSRTWDVETLECDRILDFIGVDPPSIQIYPIETHIAEKLHAYTMPRPRPNSRVKDLRDIALLGTIRALGRGGCATRSCGRLSFAATPCRLPCPNRPRSGHSRMAQWPSVTSWLAGRSWTSPRPRPT